MLLLISASHLTTLITGPGPANAWELMIQGSIPPAEKYEQPPPVQHAGDSLAASATA